MKSDSQPGLASLRVRRENQVIERDISRVITRLYIPDGDPVRVKKIIRRILQLEEREVQMQLNATIQNFSERHKDIEKILEEHFQEVHNFIPLNSYKPLSRDQKLLIGAYFTMEYAIESAALFNPSIVLHPDQSGLPKDSLRFIMSLRAVGEGHISSLIFRSGVIGQECSLKFDPVSHYVDTPDVRLNPVYDKNLFELKLNELGVCNEVTEHTIHNLPENFTYEELKEEIARLSDKPLFSTDQQLDSFKDMHRLANSNYQLDFNSDHSISERVIFPVSEEERGGIEDARFVRFRGYGSENMYYGTYTAYNGKTIMPQLIETRDFVQFKISTLNGKAVKNKGMALFPRKINGKYVMLSRQDGETNRIMFSDNVHFWQQSRLLQKPREPWELIQLGNCGSPIETKYGWLVLTHGVGPVRTYSIGAILLDLENPARVIGRLKKPLLRASKKERVGYVPNVVYTCGFILHCNRLIIPYSMSDIQPAIASVDLDDLVDAMEKE